MKLGMGLSHSCQSDGQKRTGTNTSSPSIVLAPESALGSHPCVALSSAQVNSILPQVGPLPKGRFLHEATNPISGRFLFEATGPRMNGRERASS